MYSVTNALGETVHIPEITFDEAERLERLDVFSLFDAVTQPELMESLFRELTGNAKFIAEFGYVVLHDTLDDEAQLAFARSLYGNKRGSEPLMQLSEALRQAVTDFFPPDLRDATRQLWRLTTVTTAADSLVRTCPELASTGSVIPAAANGSTPCSESSEATAADSPSALSADASTEPATTTDCKRPPLSPDCSTPTED